MVEVKLQIPHGAHGVCRSQCIDPRSVWALSTRLFLYLPPAGHSHWGKRTCIDVFATIPAYISASVNSVCPHAETPCLTAPLLCLSVQVTLFVRPRTARLAVRWSACSCWCSRSGCVGRPGGTNGLPTSGCPTGRLDAATATAACPAKAPWTWTLTTRCGSQTSRQTWSPSLSWPEPSEPPEAVGWIQMDVRSVGIYPEIHFEGVDRHRLCRKVSCVMRKWEITWLLVTWNRNQGSPKDLNPILSFMADLAKSSG